ncbi:hypothetical protein KW800_00455 [Candidatus Parcubacteria bacterium]|nr:hypothetical protein [Candidatus Parcubacteria bacterium]
MPHISKRHLRLSDLNKLQDELTRSFERALNNRKARQVFNELFTRTERVMFAKRLAVIGMLSRGVPPHVIAESLSMSSSTPERMSIGFDRGKYDFVVKEALGQKDFWQIIDSVLSGGGWMPPRVGGKRWKNLDKIIYKENLSKS